MDAAEPQTDQPHVEGPTPSPAVSPVADAAPAPATDEAHRPEVLEALEADLAAVEEALATLDRITAEGGDGASAAAQVAAVVSAERFPDPPSATAVVDPPSATAVVDPPSATAVVDPPSATVVTDSA